MNSLDHLASFVNSLTYDQVDNYTRERIKLNLADTLGCMIYGSRAPVVEKILKVFKKLASPLGCKVLFTDIKLPAAYAAFVNGAMAGSMAYDDLHHGATVHCGSIVIPALFAGLFMKDKPLSGQDFLLGMIVGYETMIRVTLAVMPEIRHRGYHPASVTAPFASAAAYAKILGFSEEQIKNAISIAGDFGTGLMSAQLSSNIHGFQAPYSGMHGIDGAIFAHGGIQGISEIFEDCYGSFLTTLSGKFNPEPINSIGNGKFLCAETGIKYYPTAGSVSSAIDGVSKIMNDYGIKPDEVKEIIIYVNKSVYLHCGFAYTPGAVSGAQMHIGYCLGALLVRGQVGAAEFEPKVITDQAITEAMRKIKVIHNPDMDNLGPGMGYCARITVRTDKDEFGCEIVNPKGSARNPLSEREVREKFLRQCEGIIKKDRANRIFDKVLSLEEFEDMTKFVRLLEEK